jgi:hypothetical protein
MNWGVQSDNTNRKLHPHHHQGACPPSAGDKEAQGTTDAPFCGRQKHFMRQSEQPTEKKHEISTNPK